MILNDTSFVFPHPGWMQSVTQVNNSYIMIGDEERKNYMKKLVALVLALAMMMMVGAALADPSTPSITIKPNDAGNVANGKITITYTYYKILTADIVTDPTVDSNGATTANGTVAYYVQNEAQANAIAGLKKGGSDIFNVTRVGTTDKWYVELNKDTNASGEEIATAFNNDTFLANFTQNTYENTAGGEATLPGISAGYYFIKSSLGSKMAVQTLSSVTINEKNEYVSDKKTIPVDDENSQIGQEITYTLTVNVPVTATEQIVLTDTMSKGLTFKEVKSQKIGTTDMNDTQKGAVSDVSAATGDATKFTITYTADQVKALVADGTAKVINIEVTVIVNKDAEIDTDIPNTLDLKYGNNYDAVPSTVNTVTTSFTFDKVDGTNTSVKLTGAEFNLKIKNGDILDLIEVTEGVEYRIATKAEKDDTSVTTTQTIKTNGNTVTVKGVDKDVTYQLVETKAPTGYNLLDDPTDVEPETNSALHIDVKNNKGTQLPSTDGIGTTIFYAVGGLMVLGAAIIMVSRRKAEAR